MLTLAALSLCSAAAALCWTLAPARRAGRAEAAGNLALGLAAVGHSAPVAAPGRAGSALHALGRLTARPAGIARLERLLSLAGRPPAWPLERLVLAKLALAAVAVLLGFSYVSSAPSVGRMLLSAVVAGVAFFAPDLLLHSRGQERQKTIQMELADTLDQMTISVEAGLGFDTAMARAAKNGKGPLAAELVRTLQEIQVGVSRRKAFRAMAERTTVTDLRRFVTALLQADAYGIPLADVLRTQAVEMRLKRRQRAEERAMQIPVKVVFPLILCILPTLFIVLLGPAAIDIAAVFSS